MNENCSVIRFLTEKLGSAPSFERAGPHERIFHDPAWTRVAILTAGGLCPGLNNVIKGLVEILSFDYGVKTIYGIRYGYAGLTPRGNQEPLLLGPRRGTHGGARARGSCTPPACPRRTGRPQGSRQSSQVLAT